MRSAIDPTKKLIIHMKELPLYLSKLPNWKIIHFLQLSCDKHNSKILLHWMTMNHKRSSIAITHYSESPNKEQDYQSMKLFEHKTKVLSKHGAIVPANIHIYMHISKSYT